MLDFFGIFFFFNFQPLFGQGQDTALWGCARNRIGSSLPCGIGSIEFVILGSGVSKGRLDLKFHREKKISSWKGHSRLGKNNLLRPRGNIPLRESIFQSYKEQSHQGMDFQVLEGIFSSGMDIPFREGIFQSGNGYSSGTRNILLREWIFSPTRNITLMEWLFHFQKEYSPQGMDIPVLEGNSPQGMDFPGLG